MINITSAEGHLEKLGPWKCMKLRWGVYRYRQLTGISFNCVHLHRHYSRQDVNIWNRRVIHKVSQEMRGMVRKNKTKMEATPHSDSYEFTGIRNV